MTALGGPGVLRLVELPEPDISGERDVKVRLRAAGINPADYKQRADGAVGAADRRRKILDGLIHEYERAA
jgi:NADPH:quinone reductase-like Zn-dependent oxidoreductase